MVKKKKRKKELFNIQMGSVPKRCETTKHQKQHNQVLYKYCKNWSLTCCQLAFNLTFVL